MLHGDISNHRSYVIGVRCEDCLLKYKDKGVLNKTLNLFAGKAHRAEVNQKVLSLMNYIYYDTEMTVSLIIDKENYTKEAEEFLSSFPFNQVGLVLTNISEVTMRLNTGELTYFVTDSEVEKSQVNSKYAVTVDEFNTILKRQVKRFG